MIKLLVTMMCLLVFTAGCQKSDNNDELLSPDYIAKQVVQAFIKGDSKGLKKYLEPDVIDISQDMVNKYSPQFSGLDLKDFSFDKSEKNRFGDDVVYAKHKDQTNQRYELKFSKIGDNYYFVDLNLGYDLATK